MPENEKRSGRRKSCYHCQKRKKFCDRKKPYCGRCIKEDYTFECVYFTPDSASNNNIKTILTPQNTPFNIPEAEYVVKLDRQNETITSLLTPESIMETNNMDKISGFGKFFDDVVYTGLTSFFTIMIHDTEAFMFFLNFNNDMTVKIDDSKFPCHPNVSLTAPERQPTRSFSESNKLPPFKTIALLISKFFDVYGPIAPFIDKETLETELYSLVVAKESYSILNPEKLNDTNLIGMFLIMLRLGYLGFGDSEDLPEYISKTYVDYASNLLLAAVSFNKFSITKVHALLLLFIYHKSCPEGDDFSYELNIILLVIVQSARKIGLNRNPKLYPQQHLSSKELYLWHITWIFICYLDANQAFNHGIIPLTRVNEIYDLEYTESAKFCRPSFLRILNLMNSSSKTIITFLSGEIQDRVIKKKEIQNVIQEIKSILYDSTRNFYQLYSLTNVVPSLDKTRIEQVLEFILRIDLYYKVYALYQILYIASEEDMNFATEVEKKEYFTLGLEKSLVILKLGLEFNENSKLFFGLELELFVSCRLMSTLKMMLPVIATFMTKTSRNQYLILDALLKFNSPDSFGLSDWLSHENYNTEAAICRNLIKNIAHFLTLTQKKFSYYSYACFKLCVLSKVCISYAYKILPEHFDEFDQSSSQDIPKVNNIDLDDQILFWQNQTYFDNPLGWDVSNIES